MRVHVPGLFVCVFALEHFGDVSWSMRALRIVFRPLAPLLKSSVSCCVHDGGRSTGSNGNTV